jgi:spermidine synthase
MAPVLRDAVGGARPSSRSGYGGLVAIATIAGFSGFAGLGYEIVWARLLGVSLGAEIIAVLGVLAALFGGLALGSLVPGVRIARSATPGLWYACLEIVIGAWALLLIVLFPLAGELVPLLVPVDAPPLRQWLVAFTLPFVLLLPATLAMGGTLPALEAVLAPRLGSGGAVGPVYAANTFGAVAGTLVTTFALVPAIGLSATLALCAGLNGLCAAAMAAISEQPQAAPAPSREPAAGARGRWSRLAPLFLTGLLGIGYEVLTIRVVSQILENTIYTFAVLLAAYLLGTAAGAVLHGKLARRIESRALTSTLVLAVAAACILGTVTLAASEAILAALRGLLPQSVAGGVAAELGVAAAAFLPATVAMGALFAELAQQVRDRDGSLGPALAVNTFGAALAPIVFGPVLMPLVGALPAFAAIALLYLLVLPELRVRTMACAAALACAAIALPLSPLSLRFAQVPPGGGIVWHRDGVMAAVTVVRDENGTRHLQVNNHFRMGGTASIRSDHRQAHIPLLLHPAPKRALFMGLGTGSTLSAAADHPGLVADGVEIVPEVVQSLPFFAEAAPHIGRSPNLRVHIADARRYVRATPERYDVIVADLFHPSLDGSGALYTREHFAAIRARLAEGGIFCQWLPLHQLDLDTLRTITRTLLAVFPDTSAYLAQFSTVTPIVALIGREKAEAYPADWLRGRVMRGELARRLAAVGLKSDYDLFGLYLADTAGLRTFAGPGAINSDELPIVATRAPRTVYAAMEAPAARLVELIDALNARTEDVLAGGSEPAQRRLADYWRARDRFLEMGARTSLEGSKRDFIAEVAPRLVDIVRVSADFDAAYLPVLNMARALARSDPPAARRLLEDLDRANPARSEARQLLAMLPPA